MRSAPERSTLYKPVCISATKLQIFFRPDKFINKPRTECWQDDELIYSMEAFNAANSIREIEDAAEIADGHIRYTASREAIHRVRTDEGNFQSRGFYTYNDNLIYTIFNGGHLRTRLSGGLHLRTRLIASANENGMTGAGL